MSNKKQLLKSKQTKLLQGDRVSSSENWNMKNPAKLHQTDLSRQSTVWVNNTSESFLRNSFHQQRIFQAPTSICFVCGNRACEENMVQLYSRSPRSRPDAPFFPFLEYHDPAPGADAMKDDWSVVACFVCNALLSQQWESFERGRMPISKRLYWLKRPSGCEIRQPVSQIELEEILNEHSRDHYEDRDDSDSAEETTEVLPSVKPTASSHTSEIKSKQPDRSDKSNIGIEPMSWLKTKSLICYSCGKSDTVQHSICLVHCKPSYEQMRTGVPYYPSILEENGAAAATLLHNSIAFMCISCLAKYKPKWHVAQQNFLKQDPTNSVLPRIPLPEVVLCYLCGSNVSTKFNDGLVHTFCNEGKENAHFKKLNACKAILGSVPLSFGFTYLCAKCYSSFNKNT